MGNFKMIEEIEEYEEQTSSEFEGTIIDIETIGEFNRLFKYDSRKYRDILQVIFGYIDNKHLRIYCAKDSGSIEQLKVITGNIITTLDKPLYAFNCNFESCVWFYHIGINILFDGELNKEKYESKKDAVRLLGIPNYSDPFFNNGLMCMRAWNNKEFDKAISHNRACLLKERDILLKRGYRKPDGLEFIE